MNADEDRDLDELLKGAALHRDKAPAALRQRILDDMAGHEEMAGRFVVTA